MALEVVEGIPVTVAQAQDIDWLARDIRRAIPTISESDSLEAAEAAFVCSHKPIEGPTGPMWADLSLEDDPAEVVFAEESNESRLS